VSNLPAVKQKCIVLISINYIYFHSLKALSIPLLAAFPFMTHLSGYRLGLALYFATIVKGVLGVSIQTYSSIQYYYYYVMTSNANKGRRTILYSPHRMHNIIYNMKNQKEYDIMPHKQY
jgi:hypothetical protein